MESSRTILPSSVELAQTHERLGTLLQGFDVSWIDLERLVTHLPRFRVLLHHDKVD